MTAREWDLKRNCALTPRQFGLAYAIPCLASFAIALFFMLSGGWLVLAFALLEAVAAAVAFRVYARHAGDREHVSLSDDGLLVDRCLGGAVEQLRLDPLGTRVMPPCCGCGMIRLEARGARTEIGRFVPPSRRRQVALELGAALRTLS